MTEAFWNLWSEDYAANCLRWRRFPEPAIAPGAPEWMKTWTANPDLIRHDGRFLLYFRGTGEARQDDEERDQIGGAIVAGIGPDGLVLESLSDEPLIPSGGPRSFDADILDPAAVEFDGKVFLYYSALGQEGDSIGLAMSADGWNFQKAGRIMPGRAPAVVVRGGTLWMLSQHLVGDGYGLSLFKSDDGFHFQPAAESPVFLPDAGGWDGLSVVTARLYRDGSMVYMLYGGSADTVDEPAYFGLARSADLVHWERHPGNPIFGCGPRGAPDGGCIWYPTVTETDGSFVMLYEGSRGTPRWDLYCTICMASVVK